MGKFLYFRKSQFSLAATFLALFLSSGSSNAAVKCQLHLGAGCNGPVAYEMQLCAEVTFNQAYCRKLCKETKPLCNVTHFDKWVSAYADKGRHGIHGPLAETAASDNYDQTGQLVATAGNTYTVCYKEKVLTSSLANNIANTSYSDSREVTRVACPGAIVAGPDTCTNGTVFNNDPIHPKCITKDSYCSGGGSSGNFISTVTAGFQMVDVQNQHFVSHAGEDSNLQQSAAIAGSVLPGLITPVSPSSNGDLTAAPFTSSNPKSQGGSGAIGGGSLGASTSGSGSGTGLSGAGSDSSFASKNFAMEGASFGGSGSAGGVGGGANGAGSGSGGTSWFGSGSAAVAGGASGDLEFGKNPAERGLASEGHLSIEDPENYFLLSDVDVSLFKRVTSQCRKKERSLVLAP